MWSKLGVNCGRLLCDTQTAAQELIHESDYALPALAKSILGESQVEILPSSIPSFYEKSSDLLGLINHGLKDAFFSFSIMLKLMILPLTKQLSSLCGNLWSNSLRSSRADRVEYLLLHEFHRKKYIVPEKYSSAELKAKHHDNEEHGNAETKSARKKPTYSGGLVLEPKRGFYDSYVLLLDFNSLYPSIIQEYDICFTTFPVRCSINASDSE
jgi:DNA polymerase alpha subunit A